MRTGEKKGKKRTNMKMNKFKKIISTFLILTTFFANTSLINAQPQDIELVGGYKHPSTGIIADSGGESGYALGQSMVDKIVDKNGVYDSQSSYGSIMEFQLSMMDSMSEVSFEVQENAKSDFKPVDHGQQKVSDTVSKFQVPVNSSGAIIKATCFVAPMGRSVIFFISANGQQQTQGLTTENDTTNTNTDTSNNLGLIIGGPGITDKNNEEVVGQAQDNNTDGNKDIQSGYIIDDSVWITLFMLIFSSIVLVGALVILVYIMFSSIFKRNKPKRNKIRKDTFDLLENDEDDYHDDINLDFDTEWEDSHEE